MAYVKITNFAIKDSTNDIIRGTEHDDEYNAIEASFVAQPSATQTLTNKTIALGSNTVSGTFAQFNTAVTDAELARTDAANTFTGTQTFGDLTTTGNTILGNASTDTLNVGNGDLIKDASGNVGIGVTPSAWATNRNALQIGGNTSSAISLGSTVCEFSYNSYINTSSQLVATTTNYIGYHDFNNAVANKLTWGVSAASVTAGAVGTVPVGMSLDNSGNFTIAGALSFASFLGGLGKVGSFIRGSGTATGTVAYTGVGFKPSTIIFFGGIDTVDSFFIGFTDATNGRSLMNDPANSLGTNSFAKAIYYYRKIAGDADIQEAVISTMDADGFTLSWTRTRTGAGTGNSIVVNYLAFR